MENATNALQLAFGMIIGVLLISLLVFLFRNVSLFENTKRDVELAQEISDFNKQFLAFDKSLMYGTDVISVLGLAISNNRIQSQLKTANPKGYYDPTLEYSVNIEVTLPDIKQKITKTVYETSLDKQSRELVDREDPILSARFNMTDNPQDTSDPDHPLIPAGTYTLEDGPYYEKLYNIAVGSKGIIDKNTKTIGRYVLEEEKDIYGLNDFKKRVYKCELVKQDEVGRVYYMKFVPIN